MVETMEARDLQRKRVWSSIFGDVSVEPFIQPVGPTVPVTNDPTEVFLQFFTPELIEHIVVGNT